MCVLREKHRYLISRPIDSYSVSKNQTDMNDILMCGKYHIFGTYLTIQYLHTPIILTHHTSCTTHYTTHLAYDKYISCSHKILAGDFCRNQTPKNLSTLLRYDTVRYHCASPCQPGCALPSSAPPLPAPPLPARCRHTIL